MARNVTSVINDILRVQNSGTNSTITYMISMNLAPSITTQFHG